MFLVNVANKNNWWIEKVFIINVKEKEKAKKEGIKLYFEQVKVKKEDKKAVEVTRIDDLREIKKGGYTSKTIFNE